MRQPKPFFRKQTGTWYVQIGKKQHKLGADKEEALRRYHALMIGRQPVTDETSVIAMLVRFAEWNKQHRAAGTQEFYRPHLLSFGQHVGDTLRIGDLKPHHVTAWLDAAYADCGSTYRRMAVRAVARALNWAVAEGHLEKNPLRGVKKPPERVRDRIVTAEEWQQILAKLRASRYPKDAAAFLDLITLMRETGCRPFEARTVEARHLDRVNRCLVFERHESKGKQERRVVPLSDVAYELCERLADKHSTGPIFLNGRGQPWRKNKISQWFIDLGIKGVSAYTLRHTFATEALERGVDPITVATIMGHKDTRQLMKTYQHLNQKGEHLRKALHQALGRPTTPTTPAASQPA